ncbi:MAG: sugar ABC transporter permease, partial [Oscillospiraceae bacterium]|nr:sugar ABC transporter permease [Oscillospiraceae bacterium]
MSARAIKIKPPKPSKALRRAAKPVIGMKGSRAEKIISFGYLLPSFIGVMVFFVAPFAQIIRYSMVDNPIANNFVGFRNFVQVFTNSAFQMAARNTLRFSAIAVPLAVVLSLLLAMVLEMKIPGKSKFRTFFLSPMMVPVASIVLIWQVIFDYNGALNGVFLAFGGTPLDWMKSDYSHVIVV